MRAKNNETLSLEYKYIISTGFWGGLFASLLAYLAYLVNVVPFGPGIILQVWPLYSQMALLKGMAGQLFSILMIGIVSIASAYLYYFLFRRMDSPWVGICYGLALWGMIFLGFNQLIPGVQKMGQLGLTTNILFIGLFIFYGLFVGYSLSFEFHRKQGEKNS